MTAGEDSYPSYQAALATCGKGYDAEDIARVVAWRTGYLAAQMEGNYLSPDYWAMQFLAVRMASQRTREVKVLDFGGGSGLHFHAVRSIVPNMPLRWAIVETPAMAHQANLAGLPDGLAVVTSLAAALDRLGGCDIVHASGSLSYVVAPEETLQHLLDINAPFFLLARFPAHQGPRKVVVQTSRLCNHVPGPMPVDVPDREVRYPLTFLPVADVLNVIKQKYARCEEAPTATLYPLDATFVSAKSYLFFR